MRWLLLLCAASLATASLAQSELVGPGRYPGFRNLGAMPGTGFGVTPEGWIDFKGAMSYTTPVAYSLTDWYGVIGLSNLSNTSSFSFKNPNEGFSGNATGMLMLGVPLGPYGALTLSHMILSTKLDFATNVHWTPPNQFGPVRFGVGVQDISGQGGASGEHLEGDEGNTRSYYAVATWQASENLYASLGVGDTRFRHVFGNASYNLVPRVKAFTEYDSFNWNYGLAFDLGRLGQSTNVDRSINANVQLGMVRGKYAFWGLSVTF